MHAENKYTHADRPVFMIVCLFPLDIGKANYYRKFKNFKIKPNYFFPF